MAGPTAWNRHGNARRTTRLSRAELPARPRPQRFGLGVIAALATGLGAVGMTGFVTVAAAFEQEATASEPFPVLIGYEAGTDGVPGEAAPANTGDDDPLAANPLYTTGELESFDCPAPALEPADPDSVETFLHAQTDCLDRTWEHQFEETGLAFDRPLRIYWSTEGQSPCGGYPSEDVAAFYCRQNKGLYLGVSDVVEKSNHSENPETYSRLLSHEYGHHVQGEAGIHDAFRAAHADEPSEDGRGELSRRSELQADCLGGAFLGSVQETYPLPDEGRGHILEDAEARADRDSRDRRTHGTPEHAVLWTEHGFDRMDPAACNTWDARADLVE